MLQKALLLMDVVILVPLIYTKTKLSLILIMNEENVKLIFSFSGYIKQGFFMKL